MDPYRRPLTSDQVARTAEIVTATRSRLAANRDRKDRYVDDAKILAVAPRVYLVESWPFTALA